MTLEEFQSLVTGALRDGEGNQLSESPSLEVLTPILGQVLEEYEELYKEGLAKTEQINDLTNKTESLARQNGNLSAQVLANKIKPKDEEPTATDIVDAAIEKYLEENPDESEAY